MGINNINCTSVNEATNSIRSYILGDQLLININNDIVSSNLIGIYNSIKVLDNIDYIDIIRSYLSGNMSMVDIHIPLELVEKINSLVLKMCIVAFAITSSLEDTLFTISDMYSMIYDELKRLN